MSTDEHHTAAMAATIAQAADRLGVSRWTIQRLISAGTIRSTKIGRSRRIPIAELEQLLARGEAPTGHHKRRA